MTNPAFDFKARAREQAITIIDRTRSYPVEISLSRGEHEALYAHAADHIESALREAYRAWQEEALQDRYDFELSETGRAASEKLADAKPLVLYFATEADREELVAIYQQAKPGAITRRWPK